MDHKTRREALNRVRSVAWELRQNSVAIATSTLHSVIAPQGLKFNFPSTRIEEPTTFLKVP